MDIKFTLLQHNQDIKDIYNFIEKTAQHIGNGHPLKGNTQKNKYNDIYSKSKRPIKKPTKNNKNTKRNNNNRYAGKYGDYNGHGFFNLNNIFGYPN